MNPHEYEFVSSFVTKDKKDRFLQFLDNPKRRKDLLKELSHFKHFEARYIKRISGKDENESYIYSFLKENGATEECYIISENRQLDAKSFKLRDAIGETLGRGFGTIISCKAGLLIYFEGEDERFFCIKN
jgi:hypothetical protein